jgi:hypothetical protein
MGEPATAGDGGAHRLVGVVVTVNAVQTLVRHV